MAVLRRAAAFCCLVVALTACSGSAGGTTGASPVTDRATAPTSPATTSTTNPGHTTAGPGPTASRSPDPNFDFGQAVFIESTTVRPLWLVSVVDRAVVFQNDSSAARRVVFDNADIHSTPIPPGGTWAYTPRTTVSLVYHVTGGPPVTGRVQVTQTEPA